MPAPGTYPNRAQVAASHKAHLLPRAQDRVVLRPHQCDHASEAPLAVTAKDLSDDRGVDTEAAILGLGERVVKHDLVSVEPQVSTEIVIACAATHDPNRSDDTMLAERDEA